jgi:arsenite methyltransferase
MKALRPGGAELTHRALSFCGLTAASRLLDIGCGRGESLSLIRERWGCKVAGIEPYAVRREQAQAANPGVEIAPTTAERLPFVDESFDVALAECSASLFADPAAAFAEISRVLKPGSIIALTDVYARESAPTAAAGMLRQLYTLKQWRRLLQAAGLRLSHQEDCGRVMQNMLGQLILEHGREAAYQIIGLDRCALKAAGLGYVLLIAVKEEA